MFSLCYIVVFHPLSVFRLAKGDLPNEAMPSNLGTQHFTINLKMYRATYYALTTMA